MLELGSAVVLGLVLVGLVTIAKTLREGPGAARVTVLLVAVVCLVTVLLVSASDFAHEQVLLDRPLDSLNFWSQMVIVVLLVGVASGIYTGLKALANFGTTSKPEL